MAGELKPNSQRLGALLCALLWTACVSGQTIRHHQEKVETDSAAAAVTQAEAAIEKKDYAAAEQFLLPVVQKNPKDALAWYDLGFVYKSTQRRPLAIDAYRKSVGAKPDIYEANLNLGLLLAQEKQDDEAAKYLKAALKLMPVATQAQQKALNWIALGRVEEKSAPEDAVVAYAKASALAPKDVEPHLRVARILAARKDLPGAEKEYKAAREISPENQEALAGLIDLYRENGRTAEAQSLLRDYAKRNPNDPTVHLMLGQALLKSGDTDGAAAEFDAGLKQWPGDVGLLHEVAAMYASQKKFDQAAPHYADLVKAAPDDADYHYQYGVVLMQLHRFAEAQEQLLAALNRNAKLTDAYGELAVAASENKQYVLAIKVLDARTKLAPDTPGTYFLRATAYDYLKAYPQAAENYHKFLEASNGKFPDDEWKARHRLVAIEPQGKKKSP